MADCFVFAAPDARYRTDTQQDRAHPGGEAATGPLNPFAKGFRSWERRIPEIEANKSFPQKGVVLPVRAPVPEARPDAQASAVVLPGVRCPGINMSGDREICAPAPTYLPN
jgi:hypothetical protein